MATDREILKKLFKIAKNQQKILNKLAAYPALEKFVNTMVTAWLANVMGQGKIPAIAKVQGGRIVNTTVTQDQEGRFDVQITITPSFDWSDQELDKLQQMVDANSVFERYIYGQLQKNKGLTPQNARVRTFVVKAPKPIEEIQQVEQQGNQPGQPGKPGDPGTGLKPDYRGESDLSEDIRPPSHRYVR